MDTSNLTVEEILYQHHDDERMSFGNLHTTTLHLTHARIDFSHLGLALRGGVVSNLN